MSLDVTTDQLAKILVRRETEIAQKNAEIRSLREALALARVKMVALAYYAPAYYRAEHNLAGDLKGIDDVLDAPSSSS